MALRAHPRDQTHHVLWAKTIKYRHADGGADAPPHAMIPMMEFGPHLKTVTALLTIVGGKPFIRQQHLRTQLPHLGGLGFGQHPVRKSSGLC
jgi:hypothetical protein